MHKGHVAFDQVIGIMFNFVITVADQPLSLQQLPAPPIRSRVKRDSYWVVKVKRVPSSVIRTAA